ncbi:type II secretion system protein GspL [Allopusillimonas ginsengisoli]|uniref:type II secretion system protein GspL n=1 Tax=Allopusillimonas ginsengisoli TaxID=453575 RepID=UPI00148575AF
MAFAIVEGDGRLVRAGRLPLHELGEQAGASPVYAILQAEDAVATTVTVPPVPASRLNAAVIGSIEPMALSDLQQLCIAHGRRAPDGTVDVAWSNRRPLQDAWSLLTTAGLSIVALVPQQLALPVNDPDPDRPLDLPADSRWLASLPGWSLAIDALRPASGLGRWRRALAWTAAAAAIWVLGLNWYAAQLKGQAETLRQSMQNAVAQAFPQIPVIIDPLKQAQQQRDALRLSQGTAADDDFIALAQATAQVLDFAQGHVLALHYDKGVLTLTLTEGYTAPANEAALAQAASVRQLLLEKDPAQAHVWHARRVGISDTNTGRS